VENGNFVEISHLVCTVMSAVSAESENQMKTRNWADAQRDACPADYRWHPLLNAAKFG